MKNVPESKAEVRTLHPSHLGSTFVVHVLYRENASWQGTVQWLGARRSISFRSVFEMITLLQEAVNIHQHNGSDTTDT